MLGELTLDLYKVKGKQACSTDTNTPHPPPKKKPNKKQRRKNRQIKLKTNPNFKKQVRGKHTGRNDTITHKAKTTSDLIS